MTDRGIPLVLDAEGRAAPPRQNGELVFAEPWESRAFGLALAVHAGGHFDWEDFRQALIAEISRWESAHPDGECWSYYSCWLTALEQIVAAEELVAPADLQRRVSELAARPPGHDHHH